MTAHPTMKRSALKPGKPLQRKTPLRHGQPMKSGRPKTTKIRQSARGEECTLRLPGVCSYDNATVVWCHSNWAEDGKGMGLKARDEEGCYGCYACHAVLDGGKRPDGMSQLQLRAYFDRARELSQAILRRKNLLK